MSKFLIQTGRFDYENIEYDGTLEEFIDELSSTKWWITEDGNAIHTIQIQNVEEMETTND